MGKGKRETARSKSPVRDDANTEKDVKPNIPKASASSSSSSTIDTIPKIPVDEIEMFELTQERKYLNYGPRIDPDVYFVDMGIIPKYTTVSDYIYKIPIPPIFLEANVITLNEKQEVDRKFSPHLKKQYNDINNGIISDDIKQYFEERYNKFLRYKTLPQNLNLNILPTNENRLGSPIEYYIHLFYTTYLQLCHSLIALDLNALTLSPEEIMTRLKPIGNIIDRLILASWHISFTAKSLYTIDQIHITIYMIFRESEMSFMKTLKTLFPTESFDSIDEMYNNDQFNILYKGIDQLQLIFYRARDLLRFSDGDDTNEIINAYKNKIKTFGPLYESKHLFTFSYRQEVNETDIYNEQTFHESMNDFIGNALKSSLVIENLPSHVYDIRFDVECIYIYKPPEVQTDPIEFINHSLRLWFSRALVVFFELERCKNKIPGGVSLDDVVEDEILWNIIRKHKTMPEAVDINNASHSIDEFDLWLTTIMTCVKNSIFKGYSYIPSASLFGFSTHVFTGIELDNFFSGLNSTDTPHIYYFIFGKITKWDESMFEKEKCSKKLATIMVTDHQYSFTHPLGINEKFYNETTRDTNDARDPQADIPSRIVRINLTKTISMYIQMSPIHYNGAHLQKGKRHKPTPVLRVCAYENHTVEKKPHFNVSILEIYFDSHFTADEKKSFAEALEKDEEEEEALEKDKEEEASEKDEEEEASEKDEEIIIDDIVYTIKKSILFISDEQIGIVERNIELKKDLLFWMHVYLELLLVFNRVLVLLEEKEKDIFSNKTSDPTPAHHRYIRSIYINMQKQTRKGELKQPYSKTGTLKLFKDIFLGMKNTQGASLIEFSPSKNVCKSIYSDGRTTLIDNPRNLPYFGIEESFAGVLHAIKFSKAPTEIDNHILCDTSFHRFLKMDRFCDIVYLKKRSKIDMLHALVNDEKNTNYKSTINDVLFPKIFFEPLDINIMKADPVYIGSIMTTLCRMTKNILKPICILADVHRDDKQRKIEFKHGLIIDNHEKKEIFSSIVTQPGRKSVPINLVEGCDNKLLGSLITNPKFIQPMNIMMEGEGETYTPVGASSSSSSSSSKPQASSSSSSSSLNDAAAAEAAVAALVALYSSPSKKVKRPAKNKKSRDETDSERTESEDEETTSPSRTLSYKEIEPSQYNDNGNSQAIKAFLTRLVTYDRMDMTNLEERLKFLEDDISKINVKIAKAHGKGRPTKLEEGILALENTKKEALSEIIKELKIKYKGKTEEEKNLIRETVSLRLKAEETKPTKKQRRGVSPTPPAPPTSSDSVSILKSINPSHAPVQNTVQPSTLAQSAASSSSSSSSTTHTTKYNTMDSAINRPGRPHLKRRAVNQPVNFDKLTKSKTSLISKAKNIINSILEAKSDKIKEEMNKRINNWILASEANDIEVDDKTKSDERLKMQYTVQVEILKTELLAIMENANDNIIESEKKIAELKKDEEVLEEDNARLKKLINAISINTDAYNVAVAAGMILERYEEINHNKGGYKGKNIIASIETKNMDVKGVDFTKEHKFKNIKFKNNEDDNAEKMDIDEEESNEDYKLMKEGEGEEEEETQKIPEDPDPDL